MHVNVCLHDGEKQGHSLVGSVVGNLSTAEPSIAISFQRKGCNARNIIIETLNDVIVND